MKKDSIRKYFFVLIALMFLSVQSQDVNNKWALGVGAGGLLYSEQDLKTVGFRYSEQFPRLSIARYMFKNVTFAGQFSRSIDENKKYITFDGDIRYDFGTSENMISIYVLLGGSLIDTKYVLPFINLGAGGTLWISDKFGLNSQLSYKYNNSGFTSQASHIFASGGLVYRFNLNGNKVGSVRKSKKTRTRLWEMRH